jgi:hypothetical protein
MVVRQLTPGFRTKIILYPDLLPLEDTEEFAQALYSLAHEHARAGIARISGEAIDIWADILRRARRA